MSQPALDSHDSLWVEDIVKCANRLDSYWENSSTQRSAPLENGFTPPPRFENLTSVGHGGMGVVYSAVDKQTNEKVAIKVGRALEGHSDYIKREFRTLAQIRHPNLVVLKELHQFGDSVFFTMEYIHGDSFNSKPVSKKNDGCSWRLEQLTNLADELLQLVDGIDFLHQRGYVHCDIKPSNILITKSGRVVVLDLGLARPSRPKRHRQMKCLGGTAAYMSPEQASGEPLQPASDWFSFGVVMFEALFGHRPFQGSPVDVLFDKLAGNVAVPSLERTNVPELLSNLCVGLLSPDPMERPCVEDVRRCLDSFSSQFSVATPSQALQSSFFGRREELEVLDSALADVNNGSHPSLLFVEGASGVGKTCLIRKFLETQESSAETIVLSGRCHENERIPYKALDAVIGELAVQWRFYEEPDSASTPLINAVSAVFKSFSPRSGKTGDGSAPPVHVAQKAGAGLREILESLLAQGKKIIIFIDDVQWADADSGQLLSEIICDIPLLLICSHRPMEVPNQFLFHLESEISTSKHVNGIINRVKVEPFSKHDMEQFFEFCFPDLSRHAFEEAIAASEGVPMFLTSLVQQICVMPTAQVKANTLDWTIGLDCQTKHLLDIVCTSGYPLPRQIAMKAAQIHEDWEACVSVLYSRKLVTLSQVDGEMELTPFHDMIRESVYSGLDVSQKKDAHSAIATVSEGVVGVPPDRLAFHFRELGDLVKFCRYSTSAGDEAAKSQAFGEAVRAYSETLENFVGTDKEKQNLKQKLASSLGRLGWASQAGDLYLELASADANGQLEFLQQSAYQFCLAGRVRDAVQGFDRLLQPWGYSTFQSESHVLLRLAWSCLKLRLSDATARVRNSIPWGQRLANVVSVLGSPTEHADGNSVDRQASKRSQLCDLLWDTGAAFSFFDVPQAVLFFQYSQQVATQEGDEVRILRGNIMRAFLEASRGAAQRNLVKKLLTTSNTAVTKRIPYLAGLHSLSAGMSAHCLGEWETAYEKCSQAEQCFKTNCVELALFEGRSVVHLDQMGIGAAQLFKTFELRFAGRFKEMVACYNELLSAPENREHLLNRSNLMIHVGFYVWLLSDNPTQAQSLLDEAIEGWPADRFRFLHLMNEFARIQIHLYSQDYQAASQAIDQYWKKARWSNLFRLEVNRIFVLEIRGRCAAARLGNINRVRDQRIANRVIKKLRQEKAVWARPMAHKIRAVLELKKQNFKAAETALLAARDGFKQCNMRHYQHTAEAKLCEILGQLETERFQKVRDWFDSHEVKNRQAFVEMHYPTWD